MPQRGRSRTALASLKRAARGGVNKFRDNVSNYDRERAINGIKDMAGKNSGDQEQVWLENRAQSDQGFQRRLRHRIHECGSRRRLRRSPVHEAWQKCV